jgi:hypothetical protein
LFACIERALTIDDGGNRRFPFYLSLSGFSFVKIVFIFDVAKTYVTKILLHDVQNLPVEPTYLPPTKLYPGHHYLGQKQQK